MKTIFSLFILLLVHSACYAQTKTAPGYTDSCIAKLQETRDEREKAKLLSVIAGSMVKSNPNQSISYAKQAIDLARKTGDSSILVSVYTTLSTDYEGISDYSTSLQYAFLSLRLSEAAKDTAHIIVNKINIAYVYSSLNNLSKALEYDSAALVMATAKRSKKEMASAYNEMGGIYLDQDNYPKALEYYGQGLKCAREAGSQTFEGSLLGNIACVYQLQKKYNVALAYHFMAYRLHCNMRDSNSILKNIGNIGDVYLLIAQDSVTSVQPDSLVAARRTDNARAAIPYLTKAVEIGRRNGDLHSCQYYSSVLSEGYAYLGDYKNALNYYIDFTRFKDSIGIKEAKLKVAGLETQRALLVKERQITEDKRKSKERLFFISITGLLVIIISVVAVSYYRQRKLTGEKEKLANQKEGLLQEKEVLIKEIHHRVKNNLQVVVALLDLQTGNTDDEVAKRTMTESAARVKSISLIHRFLYQNEDITGIEYANFTRELFTQVLAVFKKPGQQINLEALVPETVLDIDTAVPLGLIVNELLINSFKYAFEGVDGKVTISLSRTDEYYLLTYADSGPGLPDGLDISKATSIGMTIMRSLAKQLGGKIQYDKASNKFAVLFKDLNERKKVI